MIRKRSPWVKRQLLNKSREAALNAVQTFNNPLTTFKAETFIVLMNIAWMFLLHAYYRSKGVEYRYYTKGPKRRKFGRTKSGAFKYWELERCLNDKACPLDKPTELNLKFLIGLRHEIEHHQSAGGDEQFSGRYLACCLNYERYISNLFGEQYSLDAAVAFTLQFRDFTNVTLPKETVAPLPSNVAKYLQEFDAELSDEDMKSQYFRCRFLFVPMVTNKKAQSDKVIEFVPFDSDLGKEINDKYQQTLLKEVERPKHLPGAIVELMKEEGYTHFKMHHHTQFWKKKDGRNPGKGYGVLVARTWYWYDRWVDEVRKHCAANKELYTEILNEVAATQPGGDGGEDSGVHWADVGRLINQDNIG